MSKKGFTLIELLAVIVILAIIALIATPIVLNIIKDSRDSATLRSAENYMDGVANAIATTNMKEGGDLSITTCTIEESVLNCPVYGVIDVDINKEKPVSGSITFNKGKVEDVYLVYTGNKAVVNDEKGNLVYGEFIPEAVSFATDSWATIKANANTGVYKVGEEKEIKLDVDGDGTKTSYTVRIANLPSEEEKTEGCGTEGFSETACGFVVEFADIIARHVMNPTDTILGGWPASSMYTYIQNDIYNSLPEKLQAVIIPTYVVSGHGSTSGEENFVTEQDKLYLLSGKEVYGSDTDDTSADLTRQLDYYKNLNVTTSSYSGAIKKLNGTANAWWLRSAYSPRTDSFRGVFSWGILNASIASSAYGVAVAFRIG